jgi:hypothetical protein
MTREEAQLERDRLTREHADRHTHRWMASEGADGGWSVVKVALPPGTRVDPLKATTEAKPKPAPQDDPRSHLGTTAPYHGI